MTCLRPERRVGSASSRRWQLAILLCLAAFLPMAAADPAMALSGYSSGQPAVNAQYPDAFFAPGTGADRNLKSLIGAGHRRAGRRAAAVQRQLGRQEKAALSSAAGLTPSQSGSLVLLFGAVLVVSVGGMLRWRRR